MKCADCKHYKKTFGGTVDYCVWHEAMLMKDLLELDSAEKDCLGFEKR